MLRIVVDPRDPDPALLTPAADALLAGSLVAFPTETVYGLGAAAFDRAAVGAVFAAKGRPIDDPLIVHIASPSSVGDVVAEVSPEMQALIERHWPGPLTIVARRSGAVPDVVTAGRDTVAVRCPDHPVAHLLLELAGVAVVAPSANRFSYVSPTTADHVVEDLGEAVDVVVDAGPTPVGIESTIVSVVGDRVSVLRRGAVEVDADFDAEAPSSLAPGRLTTHYSPRARTVAIAAHGDPAAAGPGGVHVGFDDSAAAPGWRLVSLGKRDDLGAVARHLYATLRDVDALGPDLIVVELCGSGGLGEAIDDRLRRAAGGNVLD